MYKINDYVLFNYNVCQIKNITEMNNQKYYVMEPINDRTLTIKAPTSQENKHIKSLLTKKEIDLLIDKMPQIELINLPDHSLEAEYKRLLNTGDREDLVKIIKTTYLRNKDRLDNGKKVGEKDNTYFNLAEKSLYSEIAVVLKKSLEEAKDYVIKKIENN